MNFLQWLALFFAAETEFTAAEAAIKLGQPVTIGDPTSGGPIKTYLFGKHVGVTITITPV
jgi:hypothetical protein